VVTLLPAPEPTDPALAIQLLAATVHPWAWPMDARLAEDSSRIAATETTNFLNISDLLFCSIRQTNGGFAVAIIVPSLQ
jgi:hypothetical protein